MDLIRSAPSVTVRELPDDGVGMDVDPPPRKNLWAGPAAGCVLGVVLLGVGNVMRTNNVGAPPGYTSSGPVKLMVLGAMCAVFSPMALLIQVMQGPPRKVLLEVRPGSMKADRSIGGDHVRSNWTAVEVQCLFVEGGGLFATTRKGDQQVMIFGGAPLNQAIATVVASRLWQPAELEAGEIPVARMKRWVILPRPSGAGGANA
jgi:hypothetical protein